MTADEQTVWVRNGRVTNLMASCRCLGLIRRFLLSRAALPASSRISAARYSRTAARYTKKRTISGGNTLSKMKRRVPGAPAPILFAKLPFFNTRWIRPTGNWRPALLERDIDFPSVAFFPPDFPPDFPKACQRWPGQWLGIKEQWTKHLPL